MREIEIVNSSGMFQIFHERDNFTRFELESTLDLALERAKEMAGAKIFYEGREVVLVPAEARERHQQFVSNQIRDLKSCIEGKEARIQEALKKRREIEEMEIQVTNALLDGINKSDCFFALEMLSTISLQVIDAIDSHREIDLSEARDRVKTLVCKTQKEKAKKVPSIVKSILQIVYDATEKVPEERKNPYYDYEADKEKLCANFTKEEYNEFCEFAELEVKK